VELFLTMGVVEKQLRIAKIEDVATLSTSEGGREEVYQRDFESPYISDTEVCAVGVRGRGRLVGCVALSRLLCEQ
jgi:hypothetical protein